MQMLTLLNKIKEEKKNGGRNELKKKKKKGKLGPPVPCKFGL